MIHSEDLNVVAIQFDFSIAKQEKLAFVFVNLTNVDVSIFSK